MYQDSKFDPFRASWGPGRVEVTEGLHALSIRNFDRACELFVDALSTFTATGLITYNDFVALTMIAGALSLPRPDLKKKVSFLFHSAVPETEHDCLLRLSLLQRLFRSFKSCLS